MTPYFSAPSKDFFLFHGDCLDLFDGIKKPVNMIFADPPYFLSNDGLTVKNGKVQSVNKGKWDRLTSNADAESFTKKWLVGARGVMADNATIWISGTHHNIFTIGKILPELGFKILNVITWQKTNPPPNFSCRYFTHSTEFIIWARKHEKQPHFYDYDLMKTMNGGKQMKDVWQLPAIAFFEKKQGKHPTQKPLPLLARIILASTQRGDLVLDPFSGSATTGIAANLFERKFIGFEKEVAFLGLGKLRFEALQDADEKQVFIEKIKQKIYCQS